MTGQYARPLSAAEVDAQRAATPGCAHVRHFNHAGSSLMSEGVLSTVVDHLELESRIGGYEAADAIQNRAAAVYASIARLLNANSEEIALVENATRAWDMASYSIPFEPGDRILTAQNEYASNVIAFLQMRDRGVSIEVIPANEDGSISLPALEDALDERVRLVAITHMPTNGGLVQPIEEIGKRVKGNGSFYLVDACQSAGHAPLDVEAIGCDFLSATSRKYLRGPRGAGFLYASNAVLDRVMPPFLDLQAATWTSRDQYELRPDARRFENWERNVAGLLGMGAAVDLALELGIDRIWATITERARQLRGRLEEIRGVTVTDIGAVKSGIVTFNADGVPAETIKDALRSKSINTTTSSVFSTRFDMEARGLDTVVRSSVHYLTTDEEIDALVTEIARLAHA
ncbi:MAG: aminotransferase class V-fold PLP-dependent enzyme [Thermomicrobiales bacterium]